MSNKKLSYSKGESHIEPFPKRTVPHKEPDDAPLENVPNIPSSYTKEEGQLSCNFICVISGGTDRERVLLNEIDRKSTFKRLRAYFVSSKTLKIQDGGLTPFRMKEVYDQIKRDNYIPFPQNPIELQDIDKIYLFTDVYHYYEQLKEIIRELSDEERAEWIISNPDIEIWIYYCFRNDPDVELRVELEEIQFSKRSSKLKEINGRFNNGGGLDTRKTFENLRVGIENSRNHYKLDGNHIPELLSTQMHHFAEDVLSLLGDEYEAWKARKARMRQTRIAPRKSKGEH